MRNNAPRSKKAQLPAGLFCELMIEVTGRSRQPGATAAVASMVKKCFFCATEISGYAPEKARKRADQLCGAEMPL